MLEHPVFDVIVLAGAFVLVLWLVQVVWLDLDVPLDAPGFHAVPWYAKSCICPGPCTVCGGSCDVSLCVRRNPAAVDARDLGGGMRQGTVSHRRSARYTTATAPLGDRRGVAGGERFGTSRVPIGGAGFETWRSGSGGVGRSGGGPLLTGLTDSSEYRPPFTSGISRKAGLHELRSLATHKPRIVRTGNSYSRVASGSPMVPAVPTGTGTRASTGAASIGGGGVVHRQPPPPPPATLTAVTTTTTTSTGASRSRAPSFVVSPPAATATATARGRATSAPRVPAAAYQAPAPRFIGDHRASRASAPFVAARKSPAASSLGATRDYWDGDAPRNDAWQSSVAPSPPPPQSFIGESDAVAVVPATATAALKQETVVVVDEDDAAGDDGEDDRQYSRLPPSAVPFRLPSGFSRDAGARVIIVACSYDLQDARIRLGPNPQHDAAAMADVFEQLLNVRNLVLLTDAVAKTDVTRGGAAVAVTPAGVGGRPAALATMPNWTRAIAAVFRDARPGMGIGMHLSMHCRRVHRLRLRHRYRSIGVGDSSSSSSSTPTTTSPLQLTAVGAADAQSDFVRLADDDAIVLGDLSLVRDGMMWNYLRLLANTGALFCATADACTVGTEFALPRNYRYDDASGAFVLVPDNARRLTAPLPGMEAVAVSACADDQQAQNESKRDRRLAEFTEAWTRAVRTGGVRQTIVHLATVAQLQLRSDGVQQDVQISSMYERSIYRPYSDFFGDGSDSAAAAAATDDDRGSD